MPLSKEILGQLDRADPEIDMAGLDREADWRPPTPEQEAIEEDWIFPSIVALGPVSSLQAFRAGGSLLYSGIRGAVTSAIAGGAEATYISPAAEVAGEIHPYLKPLVGMTLGMGSAITLEALGTEVVMKALTKSAPKFWTSQMSLMEQQGILSKQWMKDNAHILERMDQGDTEAIQLTLNKLMGEAHQEQLLKSEKALGKFKKLNVVEDVEPTERVISQLAKKKVLTDDEYTRLARVAERDAIHEYQSEFDTLRTKVTNEHAKVAHESHPMTDIMEEIKQAGGIQKSTTPFRFSNKEKGLAVVETMSKKHPTLVTDSTTPANLDRIAENHGYDSVTKLLDDVLKTPNTVGFRRQQQYKLKTEFDAVYRDQIELRVAEKTSEYLAKVIGVEKLGKPVISSAVKNMSELSSIENVVREVDALRKTATRLSRIIRQQTQKEMTAANKTKLQRLQQAHRDKMVEYKTALKIKNETTAISSRLKRIFSRSKDMRADAREQIQSFLAPLFGKAPSRLIGPEGQAESMFKFLSRKYHDELSIGADIVIKRYNDLIHNIPTRTHGFSGYTFNQLKDIDDFTKAFRFMARQERIITYKGQRALLNSVVNDISNNAQLGLSKHQFFQPKVTKTQLEELAQGKVSAIGKLIEGPSDIASGFFAQLKRMEPIVRQLDGFQDFGPAWRHIFNKAAIAGTQKEQLGQRVFGKFREVFNNHRTSTGMGRIKHTPREYWTTTSGSLKGYNISKESAVVMALNSGNKGNMKAMLTGLGATEEEMTKFLNKALFKEDWKLVNDIWDALDDTFPIIQKVYKDMTGRTLQKLKGGRYFPILADRKYMEITKGFEDLFLDMNPERFWAEIEKSFTRARIGGVKAIRMDLRGLTQHLEDVVHMSSYWKPLNEIQRLTKHPKFQSVVESTMGKRIYAQFDPWLKNMARPYKTDYGDVWEMSFHKARRNVTTVALGLVPKVGVKQTLSLVTALPEVGHRNMMASIAKLMASPFQPIGLMNSVAEASPQMMYRMKTWQREIAEMMATASFTKGSLKGGTRNMYFKFIHMFDRMTASVVWEGAYIRGLDEFKGNTHRAVDLADMVVRNTQPASAPKDLPMIMRDTEGKRLVTMFYSYYSVFHNQGAEIVRRGLAGNMSVPKVVGTLFYLAAAPAIAWKLGVTAWNAATGRPEEEFDMKEMAKSISINTLSGIPVVRDVISAKVMGYDYRVTPVADIGEELGDTAEAVYNALFSDVAFDKNDFISSAELAGYILNLPTRQMITTTLGAKRILAGESDDLTELLDRPKYKK